MTDFLLRQCCPDMSFNVGFIDPVDAAPKIADPAAPSFPVAPRDPSEDRAMAFHELAHALAAIVLGGEVLRVAIRPLNPSCRHKGTDGLDSAIVALAGPAAEQIARGHVAPLPYADAVIGWFVVNKPGGGACDLCRAFRPCVQLVGFDRREAAIGRFRQIEAAAQRLVAHEDARRFLRIGASELVRDGELPGERVHQIASEVLGPETLKTLRTLTEMES